MSSTYDEESVSTGFHPASLCEYIDPTNKMGLSSKRESTYMMETMFPSLPVSQKKLSRKKCFKRSASFVQENRPFPTPRHICVVVLFSLHIIFRCRKKLEIAAYSVFPFPSEKYQASTSLVTETAKYPSFSCPSISTTNTMVGCS